MAPEITSPDIKPETALAEGLKTGAAPVNVTVPVSDVTVSVSATVIVIVCMYEAVEFRKSVIVIVS